MHSKFSAEPHRTDIIEPLSTFDKTSETMTYNPQEAPPVFEIPGVLDPFFFQQNDGGTTFIPLDTMGLDYGKPHIDLSPDDLSQGPAAVNNKYASGNSNGGCFMGGASGAMAGDGGGGGGGYTSSHNRMDYPSMASPTSSVFTMTAPLHAPTTTTTTTTTTTPSHPTVRCSNCQVTDTPLWRRSPDRARPLCNACGLYYKQNKRHRPFEQQGTLTKAVSTQRQKIASPMYRPPECVNCRQTQTPLWRKNAEGKPICNACGLFYKLHHMARPHKLCKPTVQRRRRGWWFLPKDIDDLSDGELANIHRMLGIQHDIVANKLRDRQEQHH